MGDGLLCAGTKGGPSCPQQKGLFLPHGGGWRGSGFLPHSQGPQKDKRIQGASQCSICSEENAWDSARMETCAPGPAPPPRPRTPGEGWRAAPSPPSLGPGQQDWLTSSFSGSGSLTHLLLCLGGCYQAFHQPDLSAAAGPARCPGTRRGFLTSHLPPRPPALALVGTFHRTGRSRLPRALKPVLRRAGEAELC